MRAGVWLATEDHDLAEVNQALLLIHDFQLAAFTARLTGAGAPVSTSDSPQAQRLGRAGAQLLGESLAADYLRESYVEAKPSLTLRKALHSHL